MRILLKNTIDILYYIPRFYPAISGAEFYILNIAKHMRSISKNIEILCSTSVDFKGLHSKDGYHIKPNNPYYFSYENIPITRISPEYHSNPQEFDHFAAGITFQLSESVEKILEQGPIHTKYFIKLLNKFKSQDLSYKLIHSSYLPYATVLYSLIYSKKVNIPSICTPFVHIFNPRYQNDYFIPILKQYNHIITCTNTEKEYLKRKGISENKITTIPMGVDYQLYEIPPKTRTGKLKSFKSTFKISSPFVLFCGYKNYEKGALRVLRAAILSYKKIPKLSYVFIGPSTTAFDIEVKKARKHGVPILNIGPDNLKGYYDWRKISAFQECEFYIMPSRSDAYGISYLEAWASKKPVIGIDTPVMREVIQHKKDGLLVEFDNIPQISEAIEQLFSDKEKAREMGLSGSNKVRRCNSWKDIHKKTMLLYNNLAHITE